MDVCGLSKARPIVRSDCPTFQRHHMPVRRALTTPDRTRLFAKMSSQDRNLILFLAGKAAGTPKKAMNYFPEFSGELMMLGNSPKQSIAGDSQSWALLLPGCVLSAFPRLFRFVRFCQAVR